MTSELDGTNGKLEQSCASTGLVNTAAMMVRATAATLVIVGMAEWDERHARDADTHEAHVVDESPPCCWRRAHILMKADTVIVHCCCCGVVRTAETAPR
jgi:hypothetical protein